MLMVVHHYLSVSSHGKSTENINPFEEQHVWLPVTIGNLQMSWMGACKIGVVKPKVIPGCGFHLVMAHCHLCMTPN